jgi:hypothetical protein
MPLDPSLFVLTKDLELGQKVLFVHASVFQATIKRLAGGEAGLSSCFGKGTIINIWLGIEEIVEIRTADGFSVSMCPALGDQVIPDVEGANAT